MWCLPVGHYIHEAIAGSFSWGSLHGLSFLPFSSTKNHFLLLWRLDGVSLGGGGTSQNAVLDQARMGRH